MVGIKRTFSDSGSSGSDGSKAKRCNAAKNWCFTWNNYPSDWEQQFRDRLFVIDALVAGKEIGEKKETPHIQGYLQLAEKQRPIEYLKLPKEISWRAAKGTAAENKAYCSKGEQPHQEWKEQGINGPNWGKNAEVVEWGDLPQLKPKKKYTIDLELRPWQEKALAILNDQMEDDRTIWFLWEPKGRAGKTKFQKWYELQKFRPTLVLSGKAADMKNGIVEYMESNKGDIPEVILVNIPRSQDERFISWQGIEEVKDMFFYSGKFHGGMVNGRSPIMMLFANYKPDTSHMSGDRWKIIKIPDGIGDGKVFEDTWE